MRIHLSGIICIGLVLAFLSASSYSDDPSTHVISSWTGDKDSSDSVDGNDGALINGAQNTADILAGYADTACPERKNRARGRFGRSSGWFLLRCASVATTFYTFDSSSDSEDDVPQAQISLSSREDQGHRCAGHEPASLQRCHLDRSEHRSPV